MDDFRTTTVAQVADDVRTGRVTAVAQVQRALDAIAAHDGTIHAFVAVDGDRALADAAEIDRRVAAGEDVGALAGVPLAVKDLEDAAGFVTSMGSRVHADDPPATRDSEHVARLRAAGCVVVGKTNTPEFGWQAETSNLVFPATRNPWNTDRSVGGSSGGTAAAIAAGMVPLGTGSDGGGSIRIPSAVCGLSGLKPSLGRLPNGGPVAGPWLHFSTVGPMARRIDDVALALDAVVGPDATDLYSAPHTGHPRWHETMGRPSLPRAVLWSPDLGYARMDAEVAQLLQRAVDAMADRGVEVIEVAPFDEDPVRDWALVAFGGLRRVLWEQRELADPGLAALMDAFGDATADDVYRAMDTCFAMNHRLVELFHRAPLLLCPVTAGQTGLVGAQGTIDGTPDVGWVSCTYPFNMTGNPAGTVCAGFTDDGMPVGLQVVGPRLADVAVLRAIGALEQLLDVETAAPELGGS